MIVLKLAGALSLLGAAVVFSMARRRAGRRLLAALSEWITFLERLHHGVRSSSLPVSAALSQLSASERRQLFGEAASTDATVGELFSCAGALLGGPCGAAVAALPSLLGQAADGLRAQSEIDRTLVILREAHATGAAEQERMERITMALGTCGALGMVLMLW